MNKTAANDPDTKATKLMSASSAREAHRMIRDVRSFGNCSMYSLAIG